MGARQFAMILGAVYVLVGILGFVPGINAEEAAPAGLAVTSGYGRLLGLFPINVVHNIVHILIGVWGLAASRSLGGSRNFARGAFAIFLLLTVLGLMPGGNMLFGLTPLFSHAIWLHAVTALASAYFGFVAAERVVAVDASRRA